MIPIAIGLTGCPAKYREDLDYSYGVEQTISVPEIQSDQLVQFESVAWDPADTARLRSMIADDDAAAGRAVLEIGTGTGVIAVLCLQQGAQHVVATDVNPAAVANASYNAATLGLDADLDVRLVDPEAAGTFARISSNQRFDLILFNPTVRLDAQSGPAKIDSFLDQLPDRSKPGGRCIVACQRIELITHWQAAARQRGYEVRLLDDRQFEPQVGEVFPAALLELRVPIDSLNETK